MKYLQVTHDEYCNGPSLDRKTFPMRAGKATGLSSTRRTLALSVGCPSVP